MAFKTDFLFRKGVRPIRRILFICHNELLLCEQKSKLCKNNTKIDRFSLYRTILYDHII